LAFEPNFSRRSFLKGKFSQTSRLGCASIRPPWAVTESLFIGSCSRCGDCNAACPQGIISIGDGGYPEVSFKQGECTFCTECINVCDTGALASLKEIPVSQDAWALDVEIKSNCLSLNAIVCRACGDNCESQAIQFKLKVGGISEPLISQDNCTGCGACVSVCPVDAVSIKPKLSESIAA